ncbi:hypothetical protein EV122DRAFT_265410 [Schizophyllum commune]
MFCAPHEMYSAYQRPMFPAYPMNDSRQYPSPYSAPPPPSFYAAPPAPPPLPFSQEMPMMYDQFDDGGRSRWRIHEQEEGGWRLREGGGGGGWRRQDDRQGGGGERFGGRPDPTIRVHQHHHDRDDFTTPRDVPQTHIEAAPHATPSWREERREDLGAKTIHAAQAPMQHLLRIMFATRPARPLRSSRIRRPTETQAPVMRRVLEIFYGRSVYRIWFTRKTLRDIQSLAGDGAPLFILQHLPRSAVDQWIETRYFGYCKAMLETMARGYTVHATDIDDAVMQKAAVDAVACFEAIAQRTYHSIPAIFRAALVERDLRPTAAGTEAVKNITRPRLVDAALDYKPEPPVQETVSAGDVFRHHRRTHLGQRHARDGTRRRRRRRRPDSQARKMRRRSAKQTEHAAADVLSQVPRVQPPNRFLPPAILRVRRRRMPRFS